MIEQQLFTKTEKGLIKNTPGLDTAAKSGGLEPNYITNYVQQYCRYHAPDPNMIGSKLPKIITYASMLNSDLLLGQSTSRFEEGEKTFLSHNYIIKKGTPQWDNFVKDVSNLVYADSFLESFDRESPPLMPQLEAVPLSKQASLSGRSKTFAKNKISTQNFRLLLGAVFSALEKRKKIFISLKGSPSETSYEALEVMKYIFASLPYAVRRVLGYSTFFYDCDVVTGVEIYFVYNGLMPQSGNVIALGKRSATKDYIFDFEHENILHIDFSDLDKSEFLSVVLNYIDHLDRLAPFFEFAEKACLSLPEGRKISLRLYDDLTLLYNMENMNNEEVFAYGNRMLIALGDLLSGEDAPCGEILKVYDTFLSKYSSAMTEENAPLSNEILKRLVAQYDNLCPELKEKVASLILTDLSISLSKEQTEDVFTHINITGACPSLNVLLIEDKIVSMPTLLSTYMQYMFSQRKTVHSLFEYADELLENLPNILRKDAIRQIFYDKVVELFHASGDRYIALKYICDRCQTLKEKHPDLRDLFHSLSVYTTNQFMKNISIASFSTDHIFDFALPCAEHLDAEAMVKYNTILALKEVLMLTQDPTMAFVHYDAFGFENISKNLSSDLEISLKAEKEIKQRLWNAIRDKKTSSKRSIYPVLFYGAETKEPRLHYDFTKIFRYLDETLHFDVSDFINWFMTNNLYIVPQDGDRLVVDKKIVDTDILKDFYKTCLTFYRTTGGSLLRDSRYLQKLKKSLSSSKSKHPMFREIFEEFEKEFNEVINQNVSIFAKIIHWAKNVNKKIVIIVLVLLLAITGGILIAKKISASRQSLHSSKTVQQQNEHLTRQNVVRSSWSASKLLKSGEVQSAASVLSGDKNNKEAFNLETDQTIIIDLAGTLTINGISVSFINKPESTSQALEFSVDTLDGRKLKLREGQTLDGITYFELEKASGVSRLYIDNITSNQFDIIEFFDVNAYIYQ